MVLLSRLFALLFATLLLSGCTSLIFQPMQMMVRTPADVGLAYRDLYFEADDGPVLHGWFLPATDARGTVLLLHGNAENISTHLGSVWWLPAAGYHVVLYDYRGYGLSSGEASLAGMLPDFEAAVRKTRQLPETQGKPLFVFGQSLGGAVAISAVARSPQRDHIAGLIVEGAFADYRQITREKLAEFWLTWPLQWPLSLTIDNRYRPLDDIRRISPIPLLVIHGDADIIIPSHHATSLYEAAGEPRELWQLPGAAHIDAFTRPEYRQRLVDYLDKLPLRQHP